VLINSEGKKMRLFFESNIIPHTRKILVIVLLGFLGVAVLVPSMLPGALANNIWSIRAIQGVFSEEAQGIPSPPPYHPHAEIWLDRQALRQLSASSAVEEQETLESTTEESSPSDDPFAGFADFGDIQSLDIEASYRYQQGEYYEAIEIWKSIGQKAALAEVASEAAAYGIDSLALEAYRAAYEIDPEAYALSFARALERNGEPGRAMEVLEGVRQSFPLSRTAPSWQVMIGDIYRDQSEWQEAKRIYQAVIDENPGAEDAWIGMGWLIYQRDGDVVKAVEQFDIAIAVDPQSGVGQAAIGSLFSQRGQYDIAAEWYRVAFDRNQESLSYGLSFASALWQDSQREQALSVYQNLVRRFPDAPNLHYQLARVYQGAGMEDAAVSAIETALAISEVPDLSHYILAREIYQETGQGAKIQALYDEADAAFQEVLAAFPGFPEPYLYLGRLNEAFNRPQLALDAYQAALDLDPDNAAALQALERLGEGE